MWQRLPLGAEPVSPADATLCLALPPTRSLGASALPNLLVLYHQSFTKGFHPSQALAYPHLLKCLPVCMLVDPMVLPLQQAGKGSTS